MGKDLTKVLLMKQAQEKEREKEEHKRKGYEDWDEDDYESEYAYRGGRSGAMTRGGRMGGMRGRRIGNAMTYTVKPMPPYDPVDEPIPPVNGVESPMMYDMWNPMHPKKYPFYDEPPYYYTNEPNRYGSRSIWASGDITMDEPWMIQPERRYPKIERYHNEAAQPITQGKARKVVHKMKNVDGTDGEHWDMEQTETLRQQHAPDCKPAEFYVAMNMMYSDYQDVAKKFGVDRPEFYACMACSFLCDDDAVEDKLQKYIQYIVE